MYRNWWCGNFASASIESKARHYSTSQDDVGSASFLIGSQTRSSLSNVQASAFDRIAQQVHPRFVACGYIFLHSTRKLFFLCDAHEDGRRKIFQVNAALKNQIRFFLARIRRDGITSQHDGVIKPRRVISVIE